MVEPSLMRAERGMLNLPGAPVKEQAMASTRWACYPLITGRQGQGPERCLHSIMACLAFLQ